MRQSVITRHGSPDVFELRESADPTPGPGEVRIRVRAAGVNFADVLARLGLYPDAPKPPVVVGYEVAGRVDAVGPGVPRIAEGDRVVALTRFGGYSDTVVVPAEHAFHLPERLSDAAAAAVPVTYLTATQLARLRRAVVIGTASTGKHAALRSFGVEHAIDYRHGNVASEVKKLTHGRGADVILDPIGGRSFAESYRLLAPLGRLVIFGLSAAAPGETRSLWRAFRAWRQSPRFDPMSLINRNRGVFGLHVGHLWQERQAIMPLVDMLFPLEQAADAHRYLQSRQNIGKVVLTT
jgi:NADPH:quinone reductase-like Zn-dependent oxidoreductase